MRFTSENIMCDIETALRERTDLEWSNTDRLLLKAQLHIAGLQRQLDYAESVKELTDEKILELSEQWLDMSWQTGVIDFARAILRKAQEK